MVSGPFCRTSRRSSTAGRSESRPTGSSSSCLRTATATAAELAFTVLVKRHGPMVFRACRAILRDPHAAEDAFQATFLVLARKAGGTVGPRLAGTMAPVGRASCRLLRPHGRVPTASP